MAHCGLPIETNWKSKLRPAASSVPRPSSPPLGKSGAVSLARPMSTVQVRSPVMRGRTSPAAVETEKVSWSVQPLRRRYMTASRTPLPDSSASEPSGLKMRRSATKALSRGLVEQQDAVAAHPGVRRAERAHARGRQLDAELALLDDRVVVAQGLPLLEPHSGGTLGVVAPISGIAESAAEAGASGGRG